MQLIQHVGALRCLTIPKVFKYDTCVDETTPIQWHVESEKAIYVSDTLRDAIEMWSQEWSHGFDDTLVMSVKQVMV